MELACKYVVINLATWINLLEIYNTCVYGACDNKGLVFSGTTKLYICFIKIESTDQHSFHLEINSIRATEYKRLIYAYATLFEGKVCVCVCKDLLWMRYCLPGNLFYDQHRESIEVKIQNSSYCSLCFYHKSTIQLGLTMEEEWDWWDMNDILIFAVEFSLHSLQLSWQVLKQSYL